MKNNKKLLYILIPAVIGIWGAIIYRASSIINRGEENVMISHSNIETVPDGNSLLPDTFSIHPNYRDPFSIKSIQRNVVSQTSAVPVKQDLKLKTKNLQPITTSWPNIIYSGLIKNQKSNKQLALLQINGQSNTMKVGDVIEGIELTKAYKDSIEVKYNKEKRFFRK